MAILELRAARGWSQEQTADAFLVTAATIASWMKRADEEGPDALVQLREPVNKCPEFVRYAVRLLKALCPQHGQARFLQPIADERSFPVGILRRNADGSRSSPHFSPAIYCEAGSPAVASSCGAIPPQRIHQYAYGRIACTPCHDRTYDLS